MLNHRKALAAVTSLVAVAAASVTMASAAPVSPMNQLTSFTAASYSDGHVGFSASAAHPSGNSLVVFFANDIDDEAANNDRSHYYAQLVDEQGAAIGSWIRITDSESPSSDGWYRSPEVKYNPETDGFMVFYQKTSTSGIYSQLVNADGTLVGGSTLIDDTYGDYVDASAEWDPVNGRFILAVPVWQATPITNGQGSTQFATFIIDADGTRVSGPHLVTDLYEMCCGTDFAYVPSAGKGLLVSPGRLDVSESVWRPVAQMIDANGERIGTDFELWADAEASQISGTSVGYSADQQKFLVAWSTHRRNDCTSAGQDCGIYAQLVNLDGTLSGDTIVLETTTDPLIDFFRPHMATNPLDDEHLLVMHGYTAYWSGGTAVWGMRISGAGVPTDPDFVQISEASTSAVHQRPFPSFNEAACNYLVTWQGNVDDSTNNGQIFSRTYGTGTCSERPTLPTTGLDPTVLAGFALLLLASGTVMARRRATA